MPKLIAGRYVIEDEQTLLATDEKSPDKNIVQLKRWQSPRLDHLVHNAFLRRAKELSSMKDPSNVPLVDFGYDALHHCYYLVYEMPGASVQLSRLLKQGTPSIGHTITILLGVADALINLHVNSFYAGYLNPPNILLAGDIQQPNVILNLMGIEGFEILLGINDDDPPNHQRNFVGEDIDQLAFLAATMLTRQTDPSLPTIKKISEDGTYPVAFREFLRRALFDKQKPYSSVSEVKRDLLKSLSEVQEETSYYLYPTKSVAQKLADLGFIPKPEPYVAAEFLNHEFNGEKFARVNEANQDGWGNQGETYSFITQRFRFRCAPAQEAPGRCLAIIAVDCPSPTSMVADREQGLQISASVQVLVNTKIPSTATILPLLDQLNNHRLLARQSKQRDLIEKSNLEIWRRVLGLQKRLLDDFKVAYKDWQLIDNGNTMLVELEQEYESFDISEDERLMMSIGDGRRSVPVGYFRELDGNHLKIDLRAGLDVDSVVKTGNITRDNVQVRSILSRQEDGLRRLRFRESTNPDLLDLLTDPTLLKYDKVTHPKYWDDGLDTVQKQAVKYALDAKDIFLIHGPPGTGKTRTIVELVRQVLNTEDDKEQKVLITSQSNVAVNHALSALLELQPGLQESVVRVGREEKAGETSNLLMDRQLSAWAALVETRSKAFIEAKNKELNIKPQLAECFGLIDEAEKSTQHLSKSSVELSDLRARYEELARDFQALQDMMTKTAVLRAGANNILEQVEQNDVDFRKVIDAFDKSYLGWAEDFLAKLQSSSKLSARRADIKDRIEGLEVLVQKLQADLDAGASLVRDTLRELFQVDIVDLGEQKKYIQAQLASQKDKALFLGRIQKISQDWCQRISRGISEFEGAYLTRCKVVGATCIGVAAKGDVSDMEFDWVIVDEAGRSTHPEIIVPMVRGKKIILVGDHRQLPPIVDKELKRDLLEEIEVDQKSLDTSLFKELIEPDSGSGPETQIRLAVQYRMSPAIGNLISTCFYDSFLKHAPNVTRMNYQQSWAKSAVLWLATNKIRNHTEKKVGWSYQNIAEADVIKNVLDKMDAELKDKNSKRSVGIIAGYMGQKRLLRQQIGRDLSRWPHLDIEINTVDAYQGQERDYIIYSVVRSNTERKIGFLQDERRLNVALSRAREFLVIVGDTETAEFAMTGNRDNPFFRVIKHIRSNPSECAMKEIEL